MTGEQAAALPAELLDALQPPEATSEAWQPRTVDEVAWCAMKAQQAHAEYAEAAAAAERLIAQAQAWLADAQARRDERVAFFEGHAVAYLQRQRAAEAEAGTQPDRLTKTLKLPGGAQVRARQGRDRFEVTDEATVMSWAGDNAPDVVTVTRRVNRNELARHVRATGEIPPGVEVLPGEVQLSLALPQPE